MLLRSAMLFATACLLVTLALSALSKNTPSKQEPAKVAEQNLTGNEVKLQSTAKELDDAATPVVDLISSCTVAVGTDRLLRNSQYDNQGIVKSEIDPSVAEIMWEPTEHISDIPAGESDLVVEGRVTDSAAFLSNDKGAVYSEVTVQVREILKEPPDRSVKNGDSVVTERFGGRVKYPNGQIVRYRIVGQGSPEKGKTYLFFLSRADESNYRILTAYELQGNKVQALDGSRINNRRLGDWAFDKHNDEDYQGFRKTVEQAVKNPHTGKPKRFNP
jgi:hypothetical protein